MRVQTGEKSLATIWLEREDAAQTCERRERQPREATSGLLPIQSASAPPPHPYLVSTVRGQALLVGDTLLSTINVKAKTSPQYS